jgi:hypothetical protein
LDRQQQRVANLQDCLEKGKNTVHEAEKLYLEREQALQEQVKQKLALLEAQKEKLAARAARQEAEREAWK